MPFDRRSTVSPGDRVLREAPPSPCARCGSRMCVIRISPQTTGRELRTFECEKCSYIEQYSVAYGTAMPWVLVDRLRH